MAESPIALSAEALQIRYGAALAVSDCSFTLRDGETITILGANGAGKSSIARACSGLVPVHSGRITLSGEDVTSQPAPIVREKGLVYVPEGRGVFPTLTVAENLRLTFRRSKSPVEALDRAFQNFPVLAARQHQRAGTMSGGEQQMLAMARVLSDDVRVAIIDEPSLGLAPLVVDAVFAFLAELKQAGRTMILIEQFAHRALEVSDSCIIMRRGRISWSGSTDGALDVLADEYLGVA